MKYLLIIVFTKGPVFCQSQQLDLKHLKKSIDSTIETRSKQNIYVFHDCDSVPIIDGPKDYKCWNFFYSDSSKRDVLKVSISFNGQPEALCFYYENNKIIKREDYKVVNGHAKLMWTDYFKNDKGTIYEGKYPYGNDGFVIIEQAYYFLETVKEYCDSSTCR